MDQIQLIIGTNRPDSFTREITAILAQILEAKSPVQIISLEDMNQQLVLSGDMYEKEGVNTVIRRKQVDQLIPSPYWIILSPEYNGSIPGVLKMWIDSLSIQDAKGTFAGKKIGLVGVSTGRAGNLRGLDHLTSILHYLQSDVMPFKLPVSSVHTLVKTSQNPDAELVLPLEDFARRFLAYCGLR